MRVIPPERKVSNERLRKKRDTHLVDVTASALDTADTEYIVAKEREH